MDSDTLQPLEFAILKYIGDKHRGAWKTKIHTHIEEDYQEYPFITAVAAQTIGRHVDNLVDKGYLSPSFVSPASVDRTYVTGFTITESGRDVMEATRSQFLENHVTPNGEADHNRSEAEHEVAERIGKQALVNLLEDEFDIGADSASHELLDTMNLDDMLLFLTLFYAHQNIRRNASKLSDVSIQSLAEIVENVPELRREFENVCGIARTLKQDGSSVAAEE